MKNRNIFLIVFVLILLVGNRSFSQTTNKALTYLNTISAQYEGIHKATWEYISSVAHNRSARKVENNRITLLKTIRTSVNMVKKMPSFENDCSLRDSVVAFLTLNYDVMNNDFGKIIDMEQIAEQSYDLMEAYMLAQEMANNKVDSVFARLDSQVNAFANKHNIIIIENPDKASRKLKQSSEALKYYNKIFLVFYKPYKQEIYLMEAIRKEDINAIEQNRNALTTLSKEGIIRLEEIKGYKNDPTVYSSCLRLFNFYKEEAESKIQSIADFLIVKDDFMKAAKVFQSKDKSQLTEEEVKDYNKAVEKYNNELKKVNSVYDYLNKKRSFCLKLWNESVDSFMTLNIPRN